MSKESARKIEIYEGAEEEGGIANAKQRQQMIKQYRAAIREKEKNIAMYIRAIEDARTEPETRESNMTVVELTQMRDEYILQKNELQKTLNDLVGNEAEVRLVA
jgi:hypothetical protein